jgi:HSP20 family protein
MTLLAWLVHLRMKVTRSEGNRRCKMTTLVPVRRETRDLWDVADEMERVFDAPIEMLPRLAVREGLWHPTMDIYNRPHEMIVELELPGVKMEDLDLTIQENHLIVEGTRNRSEDYKEDERFYTERAFGGFHRIVHLPTEVDADKAEARFHDGLLVIRLLKTRREGGKKIEISK